MAAGVRTAVACADFTWCSNLSEQVSHIALEHSCKIAETRTELDFV